MDAGARVTLLWATAGGLAPARRRIAEGARALAALGLPAAAGVDLALPDQHAVEHVATIAGEARRLLEPAAPAEAVVYVPAYEGGHPDHDAVNLAAALAAASFGVGELGTAALGAKGPGVSVVEFPLYRRGPFGLTAQSPLAPPGTPPDRFTVLPLSDRDLAGRRDLARANASQLVPSLLPLLALARWAGRGRAEPARPLP
ncbi:MAG TPA: PIG-L family deacetylase, partial [Thermoleophilia bacterium]|nr:PIG-L family deacetylase [Thermoleophilia bacterium]